MKNATMTKQYCLLLSLHNSEKKSDKIIPIETYIFNFVAAATGTYFSFLSVNFLVFAAVSSECEKKNFDPFNKFIEVKSMS